MTAKKERLDVLLVLRGLVATRTLAQAHVLAGEVFVKGQRVDKVGTRVPVESAIELKHRRPLFVSRGGHKLEAALEAFAIDVHGFVCADIGASTGGFTDCLLQRGAARVYALDVGHGQLHEKLRSDARVISQEGVNARFLQASDLPELVDCAVVDVSFISLTLVLPAMVKLLKPRATLIALVKPQFEAGPEHVEKGGVVRDESVRQATIATVSRCLVQLGSEIVGVKDSPITGPKGNREALLVARWRSA